jgi:hypothetical protein
MTRILVNLAAAITMTLVVMPTEASARMCKRVCQDGVCWSDCSKLPGEKGVFGF